MEFIRSSGLLLHPTSFPGPHGIGDLGEAAYNFVDFLVESKQTLWQVLPLGPTGYGDSPYQCFSAFAGNPLLISLEKLVVLEILFAFGTASRFYPLKCYFDHYTQWGSGRISNEKSYAQSCV